MTGLRFTIFIVPAEEANDATNFILQSVGKPSLPVDCLIAQTSHDQPAATIRLQYAV
jgi:hypothetical protein